MFRNPNPSASVFETMIYECHKDPERLSFETHVVAVEDGRVLLARSWFHPGGGGQPSDIGKIYGSFGEAAVHGVDVLDGNAWHLTEAPLLVGDPVRLDIDGERRHIVAQLHTATHILNALVFREFDAALVTGAKITGDGVAHMDFDLPETDNDRLRALERPINDAIAAGLRVRASYVSITEASRRKGLIRNLSVAPPPTPDGRFRVVEIEDLDVQACGGTHLSNTNQSRSIRVTKIDNKGRRNRRVRIQLV